MTTLVSGSYERFLFGYRVAAEAGPVGEECSLSRKFTFAAHKGPIKCIDASYPLVASGGADDTVHLYNLEHQKGLDLGFLMSPGDGAVSAVAFFTPPAAASGPTHLLSGAADGSISIWAASGEWECLKSMRGHRKEITSLAMHPTGRLALSTGGDAMLRLWNLVKGRCQHKARLEEPGQAVAFALGGAAYMLACGRRLLVHDVGGSGGMLASFEAPHPLLCLAAISSQEAVTGSAAADLTLWDARQPGGAALAVSKAHAARIRGVAALGGPEISAAGTQLASAATDGTLRVWDLRAAGGRGAGCAVPLCEASTSARLTCLCATGLPLPRETAGPPRLAPAAVPRPADAAASKPRASMLPPATAAKKFTESQSQQAKTALSVRPRKPLEGRKKAGTVEAKGNAKDAAAPAAGHKRARGRATESAAAANVADGVRVHDGVVEFLEPKPAAQGASKKKKQKIQKKKKRALLPVYIDHPS